MDAGGELEHTMEYKILKAYMERRRPEDTRLEIADHDERKVPCKMMKKHKIMKFFSCVQPQTEEDPRPKKNRRVIEFKSLKGGDRAVEVADQLTKIADSVPIASTDMGDIESDGPEEDVIQKIVDLLRESGDRLNEEVKKNEPLARQFQNGFDYNLFKKVTVVFLQNMRSYGNPQNEKAEIALTFEVTSRLTAMDNHPMNRVLGFGVKYLQENFSTWIQQHGGWDKAFDSNDDDEVH